MLKKIEEGGCHGLQIQRRNLRYHKEDRNKSYQEENQEID